MPVFRQKIHRYVGSRPVAAVAREIGLDTSTLQRWLSGQSPTLSALRSLAKGTGIAASYWVDDEIAPLDSHCSMRPASSVRAALRGRSRLGGRAAPGGQVVVPEGKDLRAFEAKSRGNPYLGQDRVVVVYDAASCGKACDGEVVVAQIENELVVGQRHTSEGHKSYRGFEVGAPPVIAPVGKVDAEWPVVAVILRARRAKTVSVGESEGTYKVAEEKPPYGRKRK